jgi:hypothetical protein
MKWGGHAMSGAVGVGFETILSADCGDVRTIGVRLGAVASICIVAEPRLPQSKHPASTRAFFSRFAGIAKGARSCGTRTVNGVANLFLIE